MTGAHQRRLPDHLIHLLVHCPGRRSSGPSTTNQRPMSADCPHSEALPRAPQPDTLCLRYKRLHCRRTICPVCRHRLHLLYAPSPPPSNGSCHPAPTASYVADLYLRRSHNTVGLINDKPRNSNTDRMQRIALRVNSRILMQPRGTGQLQPESGLDGGLGAR